MMALAPGTVQRTPARLNCPHSFQENRGSAISEIIPENHPENGTEIKENLWQDVFQIARRNYSKGRTV